MPNPCGRRALAAVRAYGLQPADPALALAPSARVSPALRAAGACRTSGERRALVRCGRMGCNPPIRRWLRLRPRGFHPPYGLRVHAEPLWEARPRGGAGVGRAATRRSGAGFGSVRAGFTRPPERGAPSRGCGRTGCNPPIRSWPRLGPRGFHPPYGAAASMPRRSLIYRAFECDYTSVRFLSLPS